MGFMDKAKQMAQQVQQEAKDGTLKERAKTMADQAQQKLDQVQGQFNASQSGGPQPDPGQATQYDQHGRPVPVPEAESATPPAGDPLAEAAEHAEHAEQPPAAPAVPKQAPSADSGMSSGDPLAG